MIYGQQSGQRAGSVWGIALSAAMGNGIVPRSTEEQPTRSVQRPFWSRGRDAGEAMVAAPRA